MSQLVVPRICSVHLPNGPKSSETGETPAYATSNVTSRFETEVASFFRMIEEKFLHLVLGSSWQSSNATLSALAWHPHRPLLAVTKEGTVLLFDTSQQLFVAELQNQYICDGIFCLEWLPESDYLLIGTSTGVCSWKIAADYPCLRQEDSHSIDRPIDSFRFTLHPQSKAIHVLSASPKGRIYASITKCEKQILIWDSDSSSNAPIRCLDSLLGHSLKWSPSGLHIMVTDRQGGLFLVDTFSWRSRSYRNNKLETIASLCWITDSTCILAEKKTKLVQLCSAVTTHSSSHQLVFGGSKTCAATIATTSATVSATATPARTDLLPPPCVIETHFFDDGADISIFKMAYQDNWVAFTFVYNHSMSAKYRDGPLSSMHVTDDTQDSDDGFSLSTSDINTALEFTASRKTILSSSASNVNKPGSSVLPMVALYRSDVSSKLSLIYQRLISSDSTTPNSNKVSYTSSVYPISMEFKRSDEIEIISSPSIQLTNSNQSCADTGSESKTTSSTSQKQSNSDTPPKIDSIPSVIADDWEEIDYEDIPSSSSKKSLPLLRIAKSPTIPVASVPAKDNRNTVEKCDQIDKTNEKRTYIAIIWSNGTLTIDEV